jgi:hypothetical protein
MHMAKGMISYSEEYTVKVAKTLEEFVGLIETGFEFVCDYEKEKVLRKRR